MKGWNPPTMLSRRILPYLCEHKLMYSLSEYPVLVRNGICDCWTPYSPQAAVTCCKVCWPCSQGLWTQPCVRKEGVIFARSRTKSEEVHKRWYRAVWEHHYRLQSVCIQTTWCISVNSYISWRDFLFVGACAIRKEQIGSVCTNVHVELYSKILGKIYRGISRLYYNITRIRNTLQEDVYTSIMTINLNIIRLRMRNI
jgi:hypothetical protein